MTNSIQKELDWNYFFKTSYVGEEVYLQIWRRKNGKAEYLASLGNPRKALSLVRPDFDPEQTKDNSENSTKIPRREESEVQTKIDL